MRTSVLVGVLLAGSVAFAQPTPEQIEKAKTLVQAAVTAQGVRNWDLAIKSLVSANELAPAPTHLFNIAQLHRQWSADVMAKDHDLGARERDLAREFYQKFLDTKPEGDLELQAQGWLAKLNQQYAREHPDEEAKRLAAAKAAEDKLIAEKEAQATAERRAREKRDQEEREHIGAAVRDQQLGKAHTVKIVGLAVGGAGIVATGVGVFFGLRARSIANELTDSQIYDTSKIDSGERAERLMTISYISGGVLLVGGGVTYLIGHFIGERATETVAVVPDRGGATFVVGGHF